MRSRPFVARPTPTSAFTLMEMIIALGLATILGLAVAMATIFASRTFEATGIYADISRASRQTLDLMTRDIRQAKVLTSYATNALVFTDLTNGTFSYQWDPNAATLTRVYNGQTQVLLTHCSSLGFRVSQRNPSNNFTFWPADPATNAKLIEVTWICSRRIFGQKVNAEAIQRAHISIRN